MLDKDPRLMRGDIMYIRPIEAYPERNSEEVAAEIAEKIQGWNSEEHA
jgi:hypothetical protein